MGGRKQRQTEHERTAQKLQDGQARALDDLAEFETFRDLFAPEIRKMLLDGASDKQIMEKFRPLMAGRLVQIGAAGKSSDAISAIRELLDRLDGKPKQAIDHTHKLAKLPESEIDAILQSKLQRLGKGTVEVLPPSEEED
jgi:hypothetical protein